MPSSTSLIERIDQKVRHHLPTAWGRLGRISDALAQRIEMAGPPILLLSLPRSGSSWVGQVLSAAENVLYLREPISEARRAHGERYTLVDVDPAAPSSLVKRVSDQAFSGLPVFPRGVIADARQWQIGQRRHKRVIIKEVNPLACAFWLQRYRPLVCFLIRHPAAVALSYRTLGWLDNPDVQLEQNDPTKTVWEKVGMRQGSIHHTVLHSLRDYPDSMIVSYEALCDAPMETFQMLFAFAGLTWNAHIEQTVQNHSTGGDRSLPYNTHRDSRALASSWKGRLDQEELDDLRRGYARFELPWYTTAQDW